LRIPLAAWDYFSRWWDCNLFHFSSLEVWWTCQTGMDCNRLLCWQQLHSHAYTRAMVCSFVSFNYYLIYLRRQIAKKICLWCCLLHCSFPSHSW
jgi:uncharacterized membrane protein